MINDTWIGIQEEKNQKIIEAVVAMCIPLRVNDLHTNQTYFIVLGFHAYFNF